MTLSQLHLPGDLQAVALAVLLSLCLPVCTMLPALGQSTLESSLDSFAPVGWQASETRQYRVDGEGNLAGLANTDPVLKEAGVVSALRKSYKRGQRFIYVDIYETVESKGAWALFGYFRRGSTNVLKRGDASSENDDAISFVKGKRFVSIYGTSEDDDESKAQVGKIADLIVAGIPDSSSPPTILQRFPAFQSVLGSQKILCGQVSASRYCGLPRSASLDWPSVENAACADYQIASPVKERLKATVLAYKTERDAGVGYRSYISALCEDRDEEPEERLNQGSNVFRTGNLFMTVALSRREIIIVSNAKKKTSPALLLRSFIK